jgi:tripartite ATP-independent transporter DctM subunit
MARSRGAIGIGNKPLLTGASFSPGHITRGMNALGVLCILGLVLLVCADIAGRNLFANPLPGVPELVALALVAAVFLQLPLVLQEDRLTRTAMLTERFAQRSGAALCAWEALLAGAGAVILLLLVVGAWPDVQRAFVTREFAGVEGAFTVTVWPVKALILLGALVAAMASALRMRVYSRQVETGRAWLLPGLLATVLAVFVLTLWLLNPEPQVTGWLMIGLLLALIALGMPIALALLICGFLGLGVLKQDAEIALRTLALAAEGTVSEYVFATVPLFVLMGMLVNASDIGKDAFASGQRLCGRLPGGLGVATVAANAIFAAITGISIASAAIFAKIALPELVQQGYSKSFAVGLIAGSSVLGMLIPPSLLLIIYGVIAEVSIGALFVAAIIPGLILALMLALAVVLLASFAPGFVGTLKSRQALPAIAGSWAITGLMPLLLLVLVVLGGIYGGLFTPTEAGAAGSFAAFLIALWRRRLSWQSTAALLRETGQVSASILFLIICASTFSMMLTLSELPQAIAALLGDSGLGMAGFLALYLLLLLVLGTVLDSTSILLIMLPLALPVVTALGGNLIWFGVITVIGIEIGLLTPPLGLSVYVIKATIDDPAISLGMIFRGALPFVIVTLVTTIVLMAVPELSLWLL